MGELSAIAFGRGPARSPACGWRERDAGLAFGAGCRWCRSPICARSAQQVMELDAAVTRVLVCNDARMHEVYGAASSVRSGGFAAAVQEEQVGKPAR